MRAYRLDAIGGPPALTQIAVPDPGPGTARVRIAACGLNFADLLMLKGQYQDTPAVPFTLGMEVAGIIDALGPDTAGPPPGTRVAVFAGQGGLADYGVFPIDRLTPLPASVSLADAAAFQIAYGTAHLALDHRARLRPGETLLVTGAAGGVGLTGVELGKLMGSRGPPARMTRSMPTPPTCATRSRRWAARMWCMTPSVAHSGRPPFAPPAPKHA